MVSLLGIGIIITGIVLLLAGAALSLYGVALLGAAVGGAAGYVIGPMLAELVGLGDTMGLIAGVGLGGVAGIILAYAILKWAIAIFGLIIGTYFGAVVIVPAFTDVGTYSTWALGIAVGFVIAALSMVFARTILIALTSLAGATLASASVTVDNLLEAGEAASFDPLAFDLADPIFLVLLVFGIVFQLGIFRFGFVSDIVGKLPGASAIRDKGDKSTAG